MNKDEIKKYLAKQIVTRKITRLQVHHMDLPNYSTWEKTDKKVFSEPHFGRTQSLNDYGKKTWGSAASDGHGHYIAQHFNVFPDGMVTTGRNLNSTPIGIKGWNTNAICIEIYGDFDKGKDVMTKAQKEAVIALYGELCKKFKLTPNTSTIRPHCWFTAGGSYLGKYDPNRSAKTCPGTNFMGIGNTKKAFINEFYPMIKEYMNGETATKDTSKEEEKESNKKIQIITLDKLNIRKTADWNAKPITTVKKGQYLDAIEKVDAKNGSTPMYKLESGLYITASTKYIKEVI